MKFSSALGAAAGNISETTWLLFGGIVAVVLLLVVLIIVLAVRRKKAKKAEAEAAAAALAAAQAQQPTQREIELGFYHRITEKLCGYEGTDCRRREVFTRQGRLVCELVMRGKIPVLYLPVEAEELWEYAEDCTGMRGLERTPLCVRIENEESLKSAINLLREVFLSIIPYADASRAVAPEEGTLYERLRAAILNLPKIVSRRREIFTFCGVTYAELALREDICRVYLPMTPDEAKLFGADYVQDCSHEKGLEETPVYIAVSDEETFNAAVKLARKCYKRAMAQLGYGPVQPAPMQTPAPYLYPRT